jgi:hypothetical protein
LPYSLQCEFCSPLKPRKVYSKHLRDKVDSSADERGRSGDNDASSIKSSGSTKSSGSYSSRGLTPDGVRQRWKEHVERREDDDHSCDSDW